MPTARLFGTTALPLEDSLAFLPCSHILEYQRPLSWSTTRITLRCFPVLGWHSSSTSVTLASNMAGRNGVAIVGHARAESAMNRRTFCCVLAGAAAQRTFRRRARASAGHVRHHPVPAD